MPTTQAANVTRPLPPQVAALTIARTLLNTPFRMAYPLLPVFARAVNRDIKDIAFALTIVNLMGLAAPTMGTVSERYGRRVTILIGLSVTSIGMLAVFAFPNFYGLTLALMMASLGKMTFGPAVGAYIGDRVRYERRGLVLGIMELGWSGAFLIGVPAVTWLIANYNWRAPFLAISILMALIVGTLYFLLDFDRPAPEDRLPINQTLRIAAGSTAAVAGLVLGFGISAANQLVNVVFATWMEFSFGVELAALAAASAVIGASELLGEGLVAGLADRFGKRPMIATSIILNIVVCFALPFTSFNLNAALVGLFFFYLTFEIALVTTIPLATEISPIARGMYMSLAVAIFTLSRAVVTPLAPFLLEIGFMANVALAAALNLVALVAVVGFIRLR